MLALAWIFVTALLPNRWWRWHLGSLLALVLLSWRLGLPFKALGRRLLVLWPFVALIGAGLLDQPDWPVRIGNLLLKATLCLWLTHLLVHTTPAPQLAAGLRRLHAPRLWVELLGFWTRYAAVLSAEWDRMRQARQARTFRWNRRREWRVLARSLGLLFLRAYERAEQIHQAMLARGYAWQDTPAAPHGAPQSTP